MSEWKDADDLKIRVKCIEYNEFNEVKHEVLVEKSLHSFMFDDDGGQYGVEQATSDASEKVYGDHTLGDRFSIESIEYFYE